MRRRLLAGLVVAASLHGCAVGPGQPGTVPASGAVAARTAAPARGVAPAAEPTAVEAAFRRAAAEQDRLYAFLRAMPKGGDLHSHLSGAVYAESYLDWAAEDGLCVDVDALALVAPPCAAEEGRPSAHAARADEALRNRLIDAFSTRNHRPEIENGHRRFFSTFGRFGLVTEDRVGDMVAEAQERAAAGGVRYLELMQTLDGLAVLGPAARVPWEDDLDAMADRLLGAGMGEVVDQTVRRLDADLERRDELLACGTPDARPGCAVEVRFLYQALRALPKEQVYAMILLGFELASRDPRVVGLNLVQPEDHRVAMEDYSLHMRMIGHLARRYPDVPVSLHAGELWEGLVPPEGLRFHVREAVEVAGARRIGHGVDILHEDRPFELLRVMAERRVMVEINLASNDVILGVSGPEHPLDVYLEHGVPVALSTDDEGVSRSEMTLEYVRAVRDQGVDYPTLRAMTRTSLEHAFVEGESVWALPEAWLPVPACGPDEGGWEGEACRALAARSTKARLQRDLEIALADFERSWKGGAAR